MLWQPLCVLTDAGVSHGRPPVPTGTCDTASGDYVIQKATTPQWGRSSSPSPTRGRATGSAGRRRTPDGTYSDGRDQPGGRRTRPTSTTGRSRRRSTGPTGRSRNSRPATPSSSRRPSPGRAATRSTRTVKLFFALGNAEMDAGIAAWYQKYKFDSIRPISAIRNQKTGPAGPLLARSRTRASGWVDGSQWLPYQHVTVLTPPFPEYISGHSTFSSRRARRSCRPSPVATPSGRT